MIVRRGEGETQKATMKLLAVVVIEEGHSLTTAWGSLRKQQGKAVTARLRIQE